MPRRKIILAFIGMIVAAAVMLPRPAVPQATPPAPKAHPEDAAIIRHLNAAITWYKQLTSANESGGQPSDVYSLNDARIRAKQALQLAFQSAEAEAGLQLLEKAGAPSGPGVEVSSQTSDEQQRFSKSAADTDTLIQRTEAQIETLNSQIPRAYGERRQALISKRDSLQEQLEFDRTLREALQKLSSFMSGNAGKAGGLQKEIADLKNSVPGLDSKVPEKEVLSPLSSPPPNSSEGTGLVSQASILFSRLGDLREINSLLNGASRVIDLAREVQAPLRAGLRATIEQGRGMADQPIPADPQSLEAARRKMNSLTLHFKQISGATLPLTQEIVLLEESQASLRQWEDSVNRGYTHILKSFLLRVAFLLIGIGMVLGFSELWRKAAFRYVREARRRHNLLLLRQIVTGTLLVIVLALGFVSQFGSLATFAGFLTAGVAFALQTVILSVAAYFFLIGRQGVRVGDRITVSGVTGDVIDVGLVRLYLMELSGEGSHLYPTGRVVVVANSVLLQGAPFFKQIPGTACAWHEVAMKLDRGSNYSLAETKLLEAVNAVYFEYRESIEQQHQALESLVAVPVVVPRPQARLQLLENALNLVVRYPVVPHRESEIDNQMARKVMEVINSIPELKAGVGSPTIRPST